MRFLFVDRIVRLEPGRDALVRKNVSNSEDFFSDHFAGRPVMPGCLILETGDQVARLLLASAQDFRRLPTLVEVTNGKFQHFVQPGDTLEIQATVARQTEAAAEVRILASVEGRRVAAATLAYDFSEAGSDPAVDRACRRMREFYALVTSRPFPAAEASAPEAGHV